MLQVCNKNFKRDKVQEESGAKTGWGKKKRNMMVKIPRKVGDKVAFQGGGKRSELLKVIRSSRVQHPRYRNKPFGLLFQDKPSDSGDVFHL